MKTHESKLAFISFLLFHFLFENRTFQRVTAKKIKKIARRRTRVPGCAQDAHARLSVPVLSCHRIKTLGFDQPKVYEQFSFLPSLFSARLALALIPGPVKVMAGLVPAIHAAPPQISRWLRPP
jgi:hypothetical protein